MGREFPQAPVVGVAGVVIRADEVLLVKRRHEPLKGEWSLPGGVLELGETLHEGVAREIFEETSLQVRAVATVEILDKIYLDQGRVQYHYVLIDFLCEVMGGELQAATDAQEARWVERGLLTPEGVYQLAPATVAVIEKAFELARPLARHAASDKDGIEKPQ